MLVSKGLIRGAQYPTCMRKCLKRVQNFFKRSYRSLLFPLPQAEFFCQLYKPEIVINELDVQVGRVRLLRKQSEAVHVQR